MASAENTYRTGIGLDICKGRIIAVQATCGRSVLVFETVLDTTRVEEARERAVCLTPAIEQGRCATSVALPATHSFMHWLTTPLTSAGKARRVLPALLDTRLPVTLESCVYTFPHMCPDANGRWGALAIAATREHVDACIAAWKERGWDPVHIDTEGPALWTQSRAEFPDEQDAARMVLYAGEGRVTVAYGRGDRLHSVHVLRETLERARVSVFSLRISQIIRVTPGGEPTRLTVLWTGPALPDHDTLTALQAALPAWANARILFADNPDTFLARALAARLVRRGGLSCDFRTGAGQHPAGRILERRRARRHAWALLAAGLILIALGVGWSGYIRMRIEKAQTLLTQQAMALTGMVKVPTGKEILLAQRSAEQQKPLYSPFRMAFAQDTVFRRVQNILTAAVQARLSIERLSVQNDAVTIQGFAAQGEDLNGFVMRMKATGLSLITEQQAAGAAAQAITFNARGNFARETN